MQKRKRGVRIINKRKQTRSREREEVASLLAVESVGRGRELGTRARVLCPWGEGTSGCRKEIGITSKGTHFKTSVKDIL